MTLQEKVAQLFGVWVGASDEGGEVAPYQHEMEEVVDLEALLPHGLGQLTRPFGTAPVDPALGALSLLRTQRRIAAGNRFGIPAVAHEECLAGFAAWGATAYPVPLSWGATFDPALVRRMAGAIGQDMRSVGVHQGLAPVLDVVRDARWGRVEETMGEDPYLVGTLGTAYVQGLESAGVVATVKHFVGYSASRAGRNLAPVGMGPRERADVMLLPFEMALREGGARSVMHAYTDTDGVPAAADEQLLTGLLRDTWGFTGTVVADYFGVGFLKTLHGVAATWGEAMRRRAERRGGRGTAHRQGVRAAAPRRGRGRSGVRGRRGPRAAPRARAEGAAGSPRHRMGRGAHAALAGADLGDPRALRGTVALDTADRRALAREVAEQAVVLLRNDGTLPLARPARIAVVGPTADTATAVLGCYAFPVHVGARHPEIPAGIELPTLVESLRSEFPDSEVVTAPGCGIDDTGTDGFAEAVELARGADVVVLALGDRGRPLRPGHQRRGLRRGLTRAAGRAGATPRLAPGHRHTGRGDAPGGSPVRTRPCGTGVGRRRPVVLPR